MYPLILGDSYAYTRNITMSMSYTVNGEIVRSFNDREADSPFKISISPELVMVDTPAGTSECGEIVHAYDVPMMNYNATEYYSAEVGRMVKTESHQYIQSEDLDILNTYTLLEYNLRLRKKIE